MFKKLCVLVALAAAPFANAFTLSVPENPTSSGTITVNWTVAQGDPELFTLELINVQFNNAFAIATTVDSSLQTLTLTLPVVPVGPGYTLQAVNIGNINDVFATTPSFSVGAATTTIASTSTGTTSRSGTSTGTGTGTTTRATTGTGTTTGTTALTTATTPLTTPASNTGTTSANQPLPSSFNTGAAAGLKPAGGVAVLAAVLAGAVAVAL